MRTGIQVTSLFMLAVLFAAGINPNIQQNTDQPKTRSVEASGSWVAIAFPTAQASFARQIARGA
jgi:hypothetical protein